MSSKFYVDHIEEASKKITFRKNTILKKDGTMTKIRRHHLSPDDQLKFTEMSKEEGRFVSPYRRGGGYWGIVETLSILGENKDHPFGAFWDQFVKVMSCDELPKKNGQTPWQLFSERPCRTASGKSVIEKVIQNIRVLQRLGGANPYGMKMAQLNACLDILGTTENSRIRLRTGIPYGVEIIPFKETSRACPTTCSIISGFSVTTGKSNESKGISMSSVIKGAEAAIDASTDEIQLGNKTSSILIDD